ncbi:four helix bundle protein [uncultured Lamprocystis sp.]|uniref:four helix bundle protein n=1 Tax=uncultured Lamprocystis sp. TaxID=543132 RepID=UPI0025D5D0E9|nr:four helix bundle protein [uncultured Lamprocystis sp.]
MTDRGHRSLRVWHLAMDLAGAVYQTTTSFPRDEVYGLVSQMRRAAVSIPSNIAEGYGRGGKDYARFVAIAYGSLLELETQTELARRFGFLNIDQEGHILSATAEIGRMLNALRASLRKTNPAS